MKTEKILNILRVVVWVVFIGAIVRAVLMAIVVVTSLISSGRFHFLNKGTLDLSAVHTGTLLLVTSLSFAVMVLYVQLWEKVKDLLTEINLNNPFTMEMAKKLLSTSYILLSIWIVSFIGKSYAQYIDKRLPEAGEAIRRMGADLMGFDAEGVYLLTAGIVYIVAQVFRRGVELQQENDLMI